MVEKVPVLLVTLSVHMKPVLLGTLSGHMN